MLILRRGLSPCGGSIAFRITLLECSVLSGASFRFDRNRFFPFRFYRCCGSAAGGRDMLWNSQIQNSVIQITVANTVEMGRAAESICSRSASGKRPAMHRPLSKRPSVPGEPGFGFPDLFDDGTDTAVLEATSRQASGTTRHVYRHVASVPVSAGPWWRLCSLPVARCAVAARPMPAAGGTTSA